MNEGIVITGASSGIGKAVALCLAEQGKTIYAVARNEKNLLLVKNEFPERIRIIAADIATEDGRDKVKQAIPTNTKISHLVNNAAIMAPSGLFENSDLSAWRYQMAVNVEAPLFLTKTLLPILTGGRVLNMSIYSSFRVLVGLGAYGKRRKQQ